MPGDATIDPRQTDVADPSDLTTLANNVNDPSARASAMLNENPKLINDPVGAHALLAAPEADGATIGKASKFLSSYGGANEGVQEAIGSTNAHARGATGDIMHSALGFWDSLGSHLMGATKAVGRGAVGVAKGLAQDMTFQNTSSPGQRARDQAFAGSVKDITTSIEHGVERAGKIIENPGFADPFNQNKTAGQKAALTAVGNFMDNTINPVHVYKNMAHTMAFTESLAQRRGNAYAAATMLPYLMLGMVTHGALTGVGAEEASAQAAEAGTEGASTEGVVQAARAAEEPALPGETPTETPEPEATEHTVQAEAKPRSAVFRGASAVSNVVSRPFSIAMRAAKLLNMPLASVRLNAMYYAADAGLSQDPEHSKLWAQTAGGQVVLPNGKTENVGIGLEQLLGLPTGGMWDFISDPVDIYANYLGADPFGAVGTVVGVTRTADSTGGVVGRLFGGLGIHGPDDVDRVFTQYQRVRNAVDYMATHSAGQINATFRGLFIGDAGAKVLQELGDAHTPEEVLSVWDAMAEGNGFIHNVAPTLSSYQLMKAYFKYGGATLRVGDALAGSADELAAQQKEIWFQTGYDVKPDSAAYELSTGDAGARARARTIIGNFFSKKLTQAPMYFDESTSRMENFTIDTASTQVSNAIGDQLRVLGRDPAEIAIVQDEILHADNGERNKIILNAYADTISAHLAAAAKNTVFDQVRVFLDHDVRDQVASMMGADASGTHGVMASGELGRDVSLTIRDGIERNSALGETQLSQLHFPRTRDIRGYMNGVSDLLQQMSRSVDGAVNEDAHLSADALEVKARWANSTLDGVGNRLDAKIGTGFGGIADDATRDTTKAGYDAKIREISNEVRTAYSGVAKDDVIGHNQAFVNTYQRINQNLDVAQRALDLVDEWNLSSRVLVNNPYERRLLLDELNAQLPAATFTSVENAVPEVTARLRGETQALKDAQGELTAHLQRNAVKIEDIEDTLRDRYPKMKEERVKRLAKQVQDLREHNPRFRTAWNKFVDGVNYYQSKIFVPFALYSGGWAIRVGNSEMLLNAFREGGMKILQDKLVTSYAKHETGRAVFTSQLEGFGERHFGELFEGSMNDMLHNKSLSFGEKMMGAAGRVAGGIILGMRDLAGGTLHGIEGNLIVWDARTERMVDRVIGALYDYAPGGLPMGVHSSGDILEPDAMRTYMLYGSDPEDKPALSIVHKDRTFAGANPENTNYYRGLRGVLTRIHDDSFMRPGMNELHTALSASDASRVFTKEQIDELQDRMTNATLRDLQSRPESELSQFDRHFAKSKLALTDAEVLAKLDPAQQLRVAAMTDAERATFYNDYDWARSLAYHDLYSVTGVQDLDHYVVHGELVNQAATGQVKSTYDIHQYIDDLPARTEPKNIPTEQYAGDDAIGATRNAAQKFKAGIRAGMDVPKMVSDAGFRRLLGPLVNSYVRDPVYMSIYDDEMEKLQSFVDNNTISEDVQKIQAHSNSVVKMSKFVHNPMDRTVFEANMRALAPFYFAQNQAWRRALRVLHENPGAFEKYLKASLAMTNYVSHLGKKDGGFITLPMSQFIGALAGFGVGPGGLAKDVLGSLSFSLAASVGSISSVVPTGSVSGLAGVAENIVRPSWGAAVTVPLKSVEGLLGLLHKPYADKYLNSVMGPIAATSSIEEDLLPSAILRNEVQAVSALFNNGNSAYASVQNYVLTNALENKFNGFYDTLKREALAAGAPESLAANLADAGAIRELGTWMDISTNAGQVHEFIDQVHAAGVILYELKTALGFVSPLSLSVNEDFSKNTQLQAILNEKLPDGKPRYTYYEGVAKLLDEYPDQVIGLVAHTQSPGSEYPETTAALHLIENNPYVVQKYPNAAAYLTNFNGTYSYPALQAELSLHVRARYDLKGGENGLGKYYDAVMIALGDQYYYNILEPRYPQVTGNQGYTNYKELTNEAEQYGKYENPTWWAQFQGGGSQYALRAQAVGQMTAMLGDANVPTSVFGPPTDAGSGKDMYEAVMQMYDGTVASYRAAGASADGGVSTAQYNIESKWYTDMTALANSGVVNGGLSYFITSVLRDLPTAKE